jgi:hypothetical protein
VIEIFRISCLNGEVKETDDRSQPDQSQPSSERGRDYSAVLSSIRADQDVKTFIADLRQNKDPLFSLMHDLSGLPAGTLEEMKVRASTVPLALYLDAALREYVSTEETLLSQVPTLTMNSYRSLGKRLLFQQRNRLLQDGFMLSLTLRQQGQYRCWASMHHLTNTTTS